MVIEHGKTDKSSYFVFVLTVSPFLLFSFVAGIKRTIIYCTLFSTGFAACLLFIILFICFIQNPKAPSKRRRVKKFKFLNENTWKTELELLNRGTLLTQPVFEESFLISENIDNIIDSIIQEFILSWYSEISSSKVFPGAIKLELRYVIQNLKQRLSKVDFAKFAVSRLIPLLNEHFDHYVRAEKAMKIRNLSNKVQPESWEYAMLVADLFNKGELHKGVTTTLEHNDAKEKSFLRHRVDSVLPFLLSPKERDSDVGKILVREILACTILANVIGMLSESDFYNTTLVKLIGDNLHRRDQVKRLRAALDEHTMPLTAKDSMKSIRASKISELKIEVKRSLLRKFRVSDESFCDLIFRLEKLESTSQLQQIQNLLHILDDSDLDQGDFHKDRFFIISDRVNMRLKQRRSMRRSALDNDRRKLTFARVLNNSQYYKVFFDFMSDSNRSHFLNSWHDIENIKVPLEDVSIDDNGQSQLELSLEFTSFDELKNIYYKYFSADNIQIESGARECLKTFAKSKGTNQMQLYQEARKVVFQIQRKIYESMETEDFPAFMKSEFSSNLMHTSLSNKDSMRHLKRESSPSSVSATESEHESEDPENEDEYLSPAVVKAVEDAFSEIMTTSHSSTSLQKTFHSLSTSPIYSNPSSQKSDPELRRNSISDNSNLFADDSAVTYSNSLFEDTKDDSEDDGELVSDNDSDPNLRGPGDYHRSGSSLFLAGPGNLSLSEEIVRLTNHIERLSEQKEILLPLLKKAEITNNMGELKILRKLMTGLEREIRTKELQKQQYIVQENDNSLYGKSRTCIQSFISGNESGKEFTLYIIEVQKLSPDDPDDVNAGWVVARRFSQFYKLNEYLKSKYPQVSGLKFPKRTLPVLKFQRRQIAEMRKSLLEDYLQQLVEIPEVCSNKAFRSFLSSENFNYRKNEPFEDGLNITYKKPKNNVEAVANKLYSGISDRLVTVSDTSSKTGSPPISEEFSGMQNELKQFDEIPSGSRNSFVKPICDILVSVFRLNNSESWLRGRALIVILQQIFGTTIEKKVYEQVDFYVHSEESILDLVIFANELLFPDGRFRESPPDRTALEKSTTKKEARAILKLFMNESYSKIFGISNTSFASNSIFGMLQNEILNKNLIFKVLDEIIKELFPETASK